LLIEVGFKGNRKEFFLWESDDAPPNGAPVIVDADRGEDYGRVVSTGDEAERRSARVPHGLAGAPATRIAKRRASADEAKRHEEVRASDDEARRKAAERVKANALVMKVTDAEWQWDRKKLTFYFTAEKRVDFRTLVRELASTFRTRIELKQIGVRDEAKRLDGVGRCGRQYCSASWLPELRPVNLGVAKDQRLSLNPSQISGSCGRLMCCLRYEHEFYVESRRKYPKEGKILRTSRTEEKVVANDIFRERVTLRGVDGEMRVLPLAQLREEMTAAGDPLAAALDAAAHEAPAVSHVAVADSELDLVDIELRMTGEHPIAHHMLPAPARAPVPRSQPPASAPKRQPAEPRRSSPPPIPAAEQGAAEGEKRAPRRRGRRGGRRNRPSGGDGASNTRGPADDGGGPPSENS
jgi:cell fate regulator YaaT (PSP1 superfamily)